MLGVLSSKWTYFSWLAPGAWLSFLELDKAVVLVWLDWLVFCEYGFSVSALWCPLATPTILLEFLLPWTSGILHGCSSKMQPLLLTLDEGYLLTAIPPILTASSLSTSHYDLMGSSLCPVDLKKKHLGLRFIDDIVWYAGSLHNYNTTSSVFGKPRRTTEKGILPKDRTLSRHTGVHFYLKRKTAKDTYTVIYGWWLRLGWMLRNWKWMIGKLVTEVLHWQYRWLRQPSKWSISSLALF